MSSLEPSPPPPPPPPLSFQASTREPEMSIRLHKQEASKRLSRPHPKWQQRSRRLPSQCNPPAAALSQQPLPVLLKHLLGRLPRSVSPSSLARAPPPRCSNGGILAWYLGAIDSRPVLTKSIDHCRRRLRGRGFLVPGRHNRRLDLQGNLSGQAVSSHKWHRASWFICWLLVLSYHLILSSSLLHTPI